MPNTSLVNWKTLPESLSYVFAAFLFATLEVFRFSRIDSVHCPAGLQVEEWRLGDTDNIPLREPKNQVTAGDA